ncbi:MAG: D-aminoacyl-tRNA deacylase [Chloroflexi bacterium]|nr:D-aminoacyl-tRNA deacylase [Chloroflexota bacterium]
MRALLQRCREARVCVAGQAVGEIGAGLMVLLGIQREDGPAEAIWLARKVAGLRVFDDEAGVMNVSAVDAGVGALVVSQFTLYADMRKGRRPSYIRAAAPPQAEPLVRQFAECLRREGLEPVAEGQFGAEMLVEIHNEGPATFWLDTAELIRR